jgi:hypothetical protein
VTVHGYAGQSELERLIRQRLRGHHLHNSPVGINGEVGHVQRQRADVHPELLHDTQGHAVVRHQSANASFEHGATTLFSAANAR